MPQPAAREQSPYWSPYRLKVPTLDKLANPDGTRDGRMQEERRLSAFEEARVAERKERKSFHPVPMYARHPSTPSMLCMYAERTMLSGAARVVSRWAASRSVF